MVKKFIYECPQGETIMFIYSTMMCVKCELDKNVDEFSKDIHQKTSLNRYCRDCFNEIQRENYNFRNLLDNLYEIGSSCCKDCKEIFTLDHFNKNTNGVFNLRCKSCEIEFNNKRYSYQPKPNTPKVKKVKSKTIKVCKSCKEELPFDMFYASGPDNRYHSSKCKSCSKITRIEKKEPRKRPSGLKYNKSGVKLTKQETADKKWMSKNERQRNKPSKIKEIEDIESIKFIQSLIDSDFDVYGYGNTNTQAKSNAKINLLRVVSDIIEHYYRCIATGGKMELLSTEDQISLMVSALIKWKELKEGLDGNGEKLTYKLHKKTNFHNDVIKLDDRERAKKYRENKKRYD